MQYLKLAINVLIKYYLNILVLNELIFCNMHTQCACALVVDICAYMFFYVCSGFAHTFYGCIAYVYSLNYEYLNI